MMQKYIWRFVALVPTLILVGLFVSGHIVWDKPPVLPVEAADNPPSIEDLQKMRAGVHARLQVLQKMTKKEWDEEGKKLGDKAKLRAPSLEEAVARHQKALVALDEKIVAEK